MYTLLVPRSRFFLALLSVSLLCGVDSVRAETTSASGAIAITSIPATGLQITQSGTYYVYAELSVTADIAYAISITAPNVTLDFNGHTLSQLDTSDNSTIGVYVNANNVTVRNGTLTGFLYGTMCWGDHPLIENMAVLADTYCGVWVNGNGPVVRHCRISNIGGETVPNLAPYAFGVLLQYGSNAVVMDCDVTTLTPGPNLYTLCISVSGTTNALVVNNRMSASNGGIGFGFGSTSKYRDNLCVGILDWNYLVQNATATDAGNNQ